MPKAIYDVLYQYMPWSEARDCKSFSSSIYGPQSPAASLPHVNSHNGSCSCDETIFVLCNQVHACVKLPLVLTGLPHPEPWQEGGAEAARHTHFMIITTPIPQQGGSAQAAARRVALVASATALAGALAAAEAVLRQPRTAAEPAAFNHPYYQAALKQPPSAQPWLPLRRLWPPPLPLRHLPLRAPGSPAAAPPSRSPQTLRNRSPAPAAGLLTGRRPEDAASGCLSPGRPSPFPCPCPCPCPSPCRPCPCPSLCSCREWRGRAAAGLRRCPSACAPE